MLNLSTFGQHHIYATLLLDPVGSLAVSASCTLHLKQLWSRDSLYRLWDESQPFLHRFTFVS